jgi:hypothetical protein
LRYSRRSREIGGPPTEEHEDLPLEPPDRFRQLDPLGLCEHNHPLPDRSALDPLERERDGLACLGRVNWRSFTLDRLDGRGDKVTERVWPEENVVPWLDGPAVEDPVHDGTDKGDGEAGSERVRLPGERSVSGEVCRRTCRCGHTRLRWSTRAERRCQTCRLLARSATS